MKKENTMRKLLIITALLSGMIATDTAAQGTQKVTEDKPLWACGFFSYQDIASAINNNNKELATRLLLQHDECLIFKTGVEFAVINSSDRWAEIIVFDSAGKPHTMYTHPAIVE